MLRPDPVINPSVIQKVGTPANNDGAAPLQAMDIDRATPGTKQPFSRDMALPSMGRQIKSPDYEKTNVRLIQGTGVLISFMWLFGASLYIQRTVGWNNVSALMPHELGGFLAGILAPVALFWMVAAFILRSNDVKMYAEALRAEIQAMIFPSDEADRRVNNDIERLIKQTAEMSRATKHILSTIASAREGLRSDIKMLDNSSEQTLDRLGRLGTSIRDRSAETQTITEKLEEAFRQIEARGKITGDIMLRMDKASQNMAQQNETFIKTTETTEAAVARLSNMLRDRLETLGSLHKQTEAALQNATVELNTQRDNLRAEAENIEAQTYAVAETLKKGTDAIYQSTDDALDKAKLIETRLEGKTVALNQILTNAVDSAALIEQKTTDAVTRLGDATHTSVNETRKLETVLQTAIDRLTERSESAVQRTQNVMENVTTRLVSNVDTVAERAKQAVHQAQNTMADAAQKMVSDVDGMSERAKAISADMLAEVNRKVADTSAAFVYIQKQIQTLATLFDERKNHLDDAGASARATAEALQKTLQLALEKVHGTSATLQDSLANISKVIEKPLGAIEEATATVQRKANDVGDMLQSRAGTLVQAAEKIGDNMIALHDQLHTKGQDVALIAGKIAGYLQNVTGELEVQNTLLNTQTKQSVDAVQNLSGMQRALVSEMASLQNVSETAQDRVQKLRDLHASLAGDASHSETRLAAVSDRLSAISNTTVEKIKGTLENMTLLEADYHRLSDSGVDHIGRVEQAYRHTLAETRAGAEKMANELSALQRDLYQTLVSETAKTTQQLSGIHTNVGNTTAQTEAAIRKQLEDIGRLVTTMQNASQNIQNTAELTVAKVSKVENFGQGLQVTLQQIGQAAQEFDARVAKSGQYITVHIDSLMDKARNFEGMVTHAVTAIVDQGDNLEQKTKEHLGNLERSFDHASSFATKLRDYLTQLRGDTEGVEKTLASSVSNLLGHGQQIDVSTTRLIDRIAEAQRDLVNQGREWVQTGDAMLSRLVTASDTIGSKASALETAAQTAQRQAEQLRAEEARVKREAFFNSTKFVVESLHSLALDFTRLLDGELPEKNWKAYQKGDVATFTRRMLNARDETTQTKIRDKFKDDVEFRTYVQRYLRQFEEVYDHATANDHADMLASVFLSSDVGKLYQFLCSVLDREARGSAVAARTAATAA